MGFLYQQINFAIIEKTIEECKKSYGRYNVEPENHYEFEARTKATDTSLRNFNQDLFKAIQNEYHFSEAQAKIIMQEIILDRLGVGLHEFGVRLLYGRLATAKILCNIVYKVIHDEGEELKIEWEL